MKGYKRLIEKYAHKKSRTEQPQFVKSTYAENRERIKTEKKKKEKTEREPKLRKIRRGGITHPCPVCDYRIDWVNVGGACPRCGAHGFKTLEILQRKARRQNKEYIKYNGFTVRVNQ
jgi:rubrerythrin